VDSKRKRGNQVCGTKGKKAKIGERDEGSRPNEGESVYDAKEREIVGRTQTPEEILRMGS